jgi:DNA-binding GntR family transcriptional regulator
MNKVRTKSSDKAPQSLAERAYRAIEEMIVLRQLLPGTMISENQLSEELGCGRTPIREALQRLSLEGYIQIHPRRGALVSPVDVLRQLELLEVRRPLEMLLVRLAAKRATQSQRAEMRALAEAILQAARESNIVKWQSLGREIHNLKAEATHNSVMKQTLGVIHGLSRRFWIAYIEDSGRLLQGAELHAAILHAIADGNAKEAERCSEQLLDYLEDFTRGAVDIRR